jgi:hypothetical protein
LYNNTHTPSNDSVGFYRPPSTLSLVNRKPFTFSFVDSSTLDSNILDTPVLVLPTNSTHGSFSLDTSIWKNFSAGQFVDRIASSSVVNLNSSRKGMVNTGESDSSGISNRGKDWKPVKSARIEPVGRAV